MPNHNTFTMKPAQQFIMKHKKGLTIDAFARDSKIAEITNDLNPSFNTTYNLDALEFFKKFEAETIDTVLFDPPYSLRQLKECYDGIGLSLTGHQTRKFYSDIKDEIKRVLSPGGVCISFGWSTVGMGKQRGFSLEEIMLLCHGGNHNDTIILKEVKI